MFAGENWEGCTAWGAEGTGRVFGYGSYELSCFPESRLDCRRVSNGAEASTPSRCCWMGKEGTVPCTTPAAGRARAGGGCFCVPLPTPNCSPRGVGSWAGVQLGPQDIQRRWTICSRLFIKTKGLCELKQSTPACWLLPGLGVCSLCANTGDVFARASPADRSSPFVLCPSLLWSVGFFPSPSA